MVRYLIRRVLTGAGVVVATAVFAYGGWRVLRPELFPGQGLLSGTWGDLELAFHPHFEVDEWTDGLQADVWMVAGTLLVGGGLGVRAGKWCALHPRTLRARSLEWVAFALFCLPPFVAGYGILILFEPTFGVIHMPLFFDVHVYQEPWQNPWDWFRALLVPWLLAGLPLFGACLRLTLSATLEQLDTDFMRAAKAKGLSERVAVRRHAGDAAMPIVLAYLSAGSAAVVLNVLITETVFSVPGLLAETRRALGDVGGIGTSGEFGIPTLQLVAIWSAVIIVAISIVFDLALAARDPRVRAAGRPG